MERLHGAFASLFTVNMGVRPGERIVVFSDVIRSDEAVEPTDRDRRQRLLETAGAAAEYAQLHFGIPLLWLSRQLPLPVWSRRFSSGRRFSVKRLSGSLLVRLFWSES